MRRVAFQGCSFLMGCLPTSEKLLSSICSLREGCSQNSQALTKQQKKVDFSHGVMDEMLLYGVGGRGEDGGGGEEEGREGG